MANTTGANPSGFLHITDSAEDLRHLAAALKVATNISPEFTGACDSLRSAVEERLVSLGLNASTATLDHDNAAKAYA